MAPGQSQTPHRHDGEDKIYYVLEGSGRFSVGGTEERLVAGEAVVATVPAYPGERFAGRISAVLPEVNAATPPFTNSRLVILILPRTP